VEHLYDGIVSMAVASKVVVYYAVLMAALVVRVQVFAHDEEKIDYSGKVCPFSLVVDLYLMASKLILR
jgi:hypothetical protein